jgi:glucose/arabinose dehydrogenase
METLRSARLLTLATVVALGACSDGAGTAADARPGAADARPGTADARPGTPDAAALAGCSGATATAFTPGPAPPAPPAVTVAAGLRIETVAAVDGARHLAALPNGDLLVATSGTSIYIVPGAEAAGAAGAPAVWTTIDDAPVQGVTFVADSCTVYAGAKHGVYRMAYRDAQLTAPAGSPIARVRTQVDGGHETTSVALAGGVLYASVGSSCNACVETDPTRATVQRMAPDGTGMTTRVRRTRNAIALAKNPATGTLWGGGAGQDGLPLGHPYEYFDAMGLHAEVADYGWPDCEENGKAYTSGASCASVVVPRVVLPAYSTIIGAAFYPAGLTGAYRFPATYRGGLILGAHGSWHTVPSTNKYYSAPRVAFVAMNGDAPATPVDWNDPTTQWTDLVGGFQSADATTRIGRPTGVAVGAKGSLFVSDDQTGLVYRIRPAP